MDNQDYDNAGDRLDLIRRALQGFIASVDMLRVDPRDVKAFHQALAECASEGLVMGRPEQIKLLASYASKR